MYFFEEGDGLGVEIAGGIDLTQAALQIAQGLERVGAAQIVLYFFEEGDGLGVKVAGGIDLTQAMLKTGQRTQRPGAVCVVRSYL